MKYSKQRELIYHTVMANPIHPNADAVYSLVREELPNISLGTVYRNLNLLSEQGLLQKISLPGRPDHFDGRLETHSHILCEKCGNVFDIDLPFTYDVEENQKDSSGFTVTGCHLYFTGVCAGCKTKTERSA